MNRVAIGEVFDSLAKIIARPNEPTREDRRKAVQIFIVIEDYLLNYMNEHGECEGYDYSLMDYAQKILDSEEWKNEE